MRDREAVVWTRMTGSPMKMGTLYVTDREARFTYTTEYAQSGLHGLGLVYHPAFFGVNTISRERTERFDFHPPIQALIPPHAENNFQRSLITKYLEKQGISLTDRFDTDWEILIHAGHGGIGHLDVFASDEEARRWFSTPSRTGLVEMDEKFGFSLKEFLTWFDEDADAILDLIGPTPTVGGAIPKLPLSIPRDGWDGRIALPTRHGETDRTDIILKLEKTTTYPGIIELEQLGLEIHRMAGFEIPRHWAVEINGLRALAVERFDRDEHGNPLFMESIYSLLASGKKGITHHYSDTYDAIGKALDITHPVIVTEPQEAKRHLLKRLVMAFLTGNGDLHLENLSLLARDGQVAFSPVYDPTPMRAYSRHNSLTPQGMSFGQYGEFVGRSDTPVGFADAMIAFGKVLKIQKRELKAIINACMEVCEAYPRMISEMETLPEENKKNLTAIHHDSVKRLKAVLA